MTVATCRSVGIRPRLPALGLALLLGACSAPGNTTLESLWPSFLGTPAPVASDSLTAQRVRGTNPAVAPVLPEGGDVWPAPERNRPTLLSGPDEAMRDIPAYRPALIDGAPPARSPVPSPPEAPRRGSAGVSAPLPPPGEAPRVPAQPPVTAPTPPPPRAEGQVITDPSGRPAVTTGEAGRVRGVTQPGLGGGAVIRDGNVETWIGPDGQPRTRVVPR